MYPEIPKSENVQVRSISREELADIAWLAGIIDGEGHIRLGRNKARRGYHARICINNTDPRMIKRISEIWGRWNVKYYYHLAKQGGNRRERLSIETIGYRGVHRVLTYILPYLTAKQEQAACLLDFIDWRLAHGFHKGRTKDEELAIEAEKVRETLSAMCHQEFNLQRLQRTASRPLQWRDEGIVHSS